MIYSQHKIQDAKKKKNQNLGDGQFYLFDPKKKFFKFESGNSTTKMHQIS